MATAVFTFLTRRHHHPSSGALFLRFLVNKAFPDLVLAPIGLLAYQNGHILLIAKTDNASFIFGVPFSFEMFLFNRLARHIVEFFFRFIFFLFFGARQHSYSLSLASYQAGGGLGPRASRPPPGLLVFVDRAARWLAAAT